MHVRDLRRRESLALHEAARSLNRFAHALSTLTESAFVMLNNVSHTPFSTGFTQLLSQPEFSNHESVLRLTAVLDDLEQAFRDVEGHIRHEPIAFIGRECPFGEECGSVIMRVGDHTLVSLVGPIRMDYSRAYAALKGAQDYLESYEG
jgi:transcriptional regulator of heat shock response